MNAAVAHAWGAAGAEPEVVEDESDGSPIRVVEVAVEGTDGEIHVRREAEHVVVTWFCGDTRSFTEEQLDTAVGGLDALASHPGMWLKVDTHGDEVKTAVMIEDGMLYGATGPREWSPGDAAEEDNGVPWEALRTALMDL